MVSVGAVVGDGERVIGSGRARRRPGCSADAPAGRAARPSAAGAPAIRASPLARATSAASSRPRGRGSPRRSVAAAPAGVWAVPTSRWAPTAMAANSTGTAAAPRPPRLTSASALRRCGRPGRPVVCRPLVQDDLDEVRRQPVDQVGPRMVGVGGDHQVGLPAQPGDRGDEVRLVERQVDAGGADLLGVDRRPQQVAELAGGRGQADQRADRRDHPVGRVRHRPAGAEARPGRCCRRRPPRPSARRAAGPGGAGRRRWRPRRWARRPAGPAAAAAGWRRRSRPR